MKWLTSKTEYEGLPLYLRIPDYKDIWQFNVTSPYLICITHDFDKVKANGLPESDYNRTLIDFDEQIVNLLTGFGIIFLVETYGGVRNYWFYARETEPAIEAFENLKDNHNDKKMLFEISKDPEWNFIKDYPIRLYVSEQKL